MVNAYAINATTNYFPGEAPPRGAMPVVGEGPPPEVVRDGGL
jgi:hypothetical protein